MRIANALSATAGRAGTSEAAVIVFGDGRKRTRDLRRRVEILGATSSGSHIDVSYVDVCSEAGSAADHHVEHLPTAILVRDGVERVRVEGPISRRALERFVRELHLHRIPR